MLLNRAARDIKYNIQIPPFGLDLRLLSEEQTESNFQYFISNLHNRIEYLRDRCSSDLKIDSEKLDFSPMSLIIVWEWFIETAKVQKTPGDIVRDLKNSKEYKLFGESFINYKQSSVASHFMLRDVGMYLGKVFVENNESIYWGYYTKPKTDVHVNTPSYDHLHQRGATK